MLSTYAAARSQPRSNANALSSPLEVGAVHSQQRPAVPQRQPGYGGARHRVRCGACGRHQHNGEASYSAIGQYCHWCEKADHFAPCCWPGNQAFWTLWLPERLLDETRPGDRMSASVSRSVNCHIRSIQLLRRRVSTIAVGLRRGPVKKRNEVCSGTATTGS